MSGQAPQWTSGAILLRGWGGGTSSGCEWIDPHHYVEGLNSCQLESQGPLRPQDGSVPHVRKNAFPYHTQGTQSPESHPLAKDLTSPAVLLVDTEQQGEALSS